nr:hypothetical protein [Candidatus Burarchaeum sp.]
MKIRHHSAEGAGTGSKGFGDEKLLVSAKAADQVFQRTIKITLMWARLLKEFETHYVDVFKESSSEVKSVIARAARTMSPHNLFHEVIDHAARPLLHGIPKPLSPHGDWYDPASTYSDAARSLVDGALTIGTSRNRYLGDDGLGAQQFLEFAALAVGKMKQAIEKGEGDYKGLNRDYGTTVFQLSSALAKQGQLEEAEKIAGEIKDENAIMENAYKSMAWACIAIGHASQKGKGNDKAFAALDVATALAAKIKMPAETKSEEDAEETKWLVHLSQGMANLYIAAAQNALGIDETQSCELSESAFKAARLLGEKIGKRDDRYSMDDPRPVYAHYCNLAEQAEVYAGMGKFDKSLEIMAGMKEGIEKVEKALTDNREAHDDRTFTSNEIMCDIMLSPYMDAISTVVPMMYEDPKPRKALEVFNEAAEVVLALPAYKDGKNNIGKIELLAQLIFTYDKIDRRLPDSRKLQEVKQYADETGNTELASAAAYLINRKE